MIPPKLPAFPIGEALPALEGALAAHGKVLLQAPPGTGKSTVVPLALLGSDWLAGRTLLMLEPRRIAARAVAQRMADLMGETVGQTVGIRTRLETRVSRTTRIEVVTEGILTRMLQSDPALEHIGCVVFGDSNLYLRRSGGEFNLTVEHRAAPSPPSIRTRTRATRRRPCARGRASRRRRRSAAEFRGRAHHRRHHSSESRSTDRRTAPATLAPDRRAPVR